MVEIKDIVDRESLEAWLKDKPKNVSQIIVHRIAMRVLPDYWHWAITSKRAKRGGISILPVLRANLTTEVVTYLAPANISPELDFTALEAGTIAQSVAEMAESQMDMFSPDDAFSYTNFFFWGERETSNAEFVANSVSAIEPYMESYAADSDLIYNGIWNLLRSDISDIMVRFTQNRPALWQNERNPFLDRWKNVKNLLKNSKENWSFWIKWYDAALKGEILNQEMLEQIALIPSEDWEKGPAHVNAIIAEIEGEFEWEEPEIEVTPAQMLNRNKSVIENQLAVLVQLVTEEINRIRGKNDFGKAEGERIAARVSVLESILAAVDKIRAALEREEPSTALAVIEEKLPEVLSGAAELATGEDQPQISVSVAQMGETISFLTQKGTPGTLATGIAVIDWTISHPMTWWKHFRK